MQEQVEQLDGSEDGKLGAVPRARAPLLGTTLGTTQGPLRAAVGASHRRGVANRVGGSPPCTCGFLGQHTSWSGRAVESIKSSCSPASHLVTSLPLVFGLVILTREKQSLLCAFSSSNAASVPAFGCTSRYRSLFTLPNWVFDTTTTRAFHTSRIPHLSLFHTQDAHRAVPSPSRCARGDRLRCQLGARPAPAVTRPEQRHLGPG